MRHHAFERNAARTTHGDGLGQHMRGVPPRGVSMRQYQEVLPQMAETVGVLRSRSTAMRSRRVPSNSCSCTNGARRTSKFWNPHRRPTLGDHHILGAVGADAEGKLEILGIESRTSFPPSCRHKILANLAAVQVETGAISTFAAGIEISGMMPRSTAQDFWSCC